MGYAERYDDEEYTTAPRERTGPQPGWIYCLVNPSIPDQVKIGLTTQDVESRMRQLDTTGVATPFEVLRKWLSADVRRDEAAVHRMLKKYRTRSNREWFTVPASKQEQLIVGLNRYMLKVNGAFYHLDTDAPELEETWQERLSGVKRLMLASPDDPETKPRRGGGSGGQKASGKRSRGRTKSGPSLLYYGVIGFVLLSLYGAMTNQEPAANATVHDVSQEVSTLRR
ncbi:MAG: GIY-YIG nuclease family protein [Pseudomonadota bacterium]